MQQPQRFQPYYLSLENPNPELTADQTQARLNQINKSITELGQHLQRQNEIYGIETPATHKAAMYRAVRTNPQAVMAPMESPFKWPYRTWFRTDVPVIKEVDGLPIMTAGQNPIMVEGETMKDWYGIAGEGILPQGPNASWRKLQEPFQQARISFDIAGHEPTFGEPAFGLTMSKLDEGLDGLAQYMGIKPIQAKQITIRRPYVMPSTTVKSQYVTPSTLVTVNPDYLARQAAFSDMQNAGIDIDARLMYPERYIPYDKVIAHGGIPVGFSSYPKDYPTSGHFSTQGFTTRGHMFAEDLESGLDDLNIWHAPTGATFKDFRDGKISEPENVIYIIGKNPNKTGMWKQGGILSAKSGIHIKKANRGKFTDYCGGKVTSECIAKGKASPDPKIRRRATFAANVRRWKHQNGGKMIPNWAYNILGGE